MRAAVVGTGWGRVHLSALTELGVEVVAVCGTDPGRTRAAADEFGVPLALTSLEQVAALDLDLVSVCAPTAMHSQVVAALDGIPLLCEKPAVGVDAPARSATNPSGPVWVNYPFGHLPVAADAEAVLAQWWGAPRGGAGRWLGQWTGLAGVAVEVVTTYDLDEVVPDRRSDWWWFTDLASHPWAWAVSRFGMPAGALRGGTGWRTPGHADASAGAQPGDTGGAWLDYLSESGATVSVATRHSPGFSGIRHDVVVRHGPRGVALSGEFHLGGRWAFAPLSLSGDVGAGAPTGVGGSAGGSELAVATETQTPDGSIDAVPRVDGTSGPAGPQQHEEQADPWYEANKSSIAAVLAACSGTSGTSGPHVFTWQEALAMDACVQQLRG